MNFRHFTVEDGLSQGSINAIFQDHKGFIWIGTHDGLNRFDGMEFKVFRHHPEDSLSLSSSWIAFLFEDSSHVLWVGTEAGLDRFDRATETFVRFPKVPASRRIVGSSFDGPTKFWMGGKPLSLFDPAKNELLDIPIGFSESVRSNKNQDNIFNLSIDVFTQDNRGHLWGTGSSKLFRIDPQKRSVEESYDIGKRSVNCILSSQRPGGGVWIGCFDELLHISNGRLVSMGSFRVNSLTEDTYGNLWIGTGDGLARLNPRDIERGVKMFQHSTIDPTSLSHNNVTYVYEDASGSLWVGTYNGLNLFNKFSPAFTVYRNSPNTLTSLGNNFVIPIMEDRRGDIWFGTFGGGVSVLKRAGPHAGSFAHFTHDSRNTNSLHSNHVRALLEDVSGKIWIGSSGGLDIFDPATKQMTSALSDSMGVSSGHWVECLVESRPGKVSAPMNGGLTEFTGGASLALSPLVILPSAGLVNFILKDSEENLWLATSGEGLLKFNPHTKKIAAYKHDPKDSTSLSNDNVWTICQDHIDTSGTLWIGTSSGLNRFDTNTGKCKRYFEQKGFPNAWVYGILYDALQRLWLSTNKGLVLFDDRLPEGRKFRNFTHTDGIAGDEFNRRAYCRLRNGEMLFAGPRGVTRFDPMSIRDDTTAPPLVLTGFNKVGKRVIFDRDVADVTAIDINHDENVFSFEFAALNYVNASRNEYMYKMEGIDHDWNYAGTRHSVNYAYLPSGQYIFRVKSSTNSGTWNEAGIAIQVRIHPPFWVTWWFVGLCVFAVTGVVAVTIRVRVRRLFEMERLRSRIARDLHDEIGSNLSSIAMASSLLGRQSELGARERGKLSEISSVALTTVKDMKDIVWLINPANDSLDDLFLRMKDTASVLLEGHEHTLNFPERVDGRKVNLDWKRGVYLIYKEALANVAKHSRATEVEISVSVDRIRFLLLVRDNGTGFDVRANKPGDGLRNMKARAEQLRARLVVESGDERGTTIRLESRIT